MLTKSPDNTRNCISIFNSSISELGWNKMKIKNKKKTSERKETNKKSFNKRKKLHKWKIGFRLLTSLLICPCRFSIKSPRWFGKILLKYFSLLRAFLLFLIHLALTDARAVLLLVKWCARVVTSRSLPVTVAIGLPDRLAPKIGSFRAF